MKNIGITSIAVLALLGQIDGATAIEMNQAAAKGQVEANNSTSIATTVAAKAPLQASSAS
jgi:hypothetical protein